MLNHQIQISLIVFILPPKNFNSNKAFLSSVWKYRVWRSDDLNCQQLRKQSSLYHHHLQLIIIRLWLLFIIIAFSFFKGRQSLACVHTFIFIVSMPRHLQQQQEEKNPQISKQYLNRDSLNSIQIKYDSDLVQRQSQIIGSTGIYVQVLP